LSDIFIEDVKRQGKSMNMHKNFLTCPYLSGSDEGVMCRVSSLLIRNISDIELDICMSKHYELCYIYCAKLQAMSEAELMLPQLGDNQAGFASIP
jgi:hypothetical protein